jgi:fatty acid amide hydrolase 2
LHSTTAFTVAMTDFKSEINLPLEIVKSVFNKSDHTRASLMYALSKKVGNFNEERIEKFSKMLEEVKNEFYEILGSDGVFLYPTHPEVAPKHGTTLLKAHNVGYTAIFNILSVPVTQCPIRLSSKSGMPIGIQIAAAPFCDHLCLTLAEEIEKAFGGWRAPCEVTA